MTLRPFALLAAFLVLPAHAAAPHRTFELTYSAGVPRGDGSGPVRLWMPIPHSGPEQEIGPLTVTCPAQHRIKSDPATGNTMLHAELPAATLPTTVTWRCTVTRRESRADALPFTQANRRDRARFLKDDKLGIVQHPAVDRALVEALAKKPAPAAVPRALYDHVLARMSYDKTAPGWGQGDTVRACQVGKGNCTDFHALFISMCRRRGLPAEFAVGLPLPEAPGEGAIQGYHCWAYFADRSGRWTPVDISEAWKAPAKKDYYFGTLGPNRVELSRGRDVDLSPRQSSLPLNYFVDPYAEQSELPLKVTRTASFSDVGATGR